MKNIFLQNTHNHDFPLSFMSSEAFYFYIHSKGNRDKDGRTSTTVKNQKKKRP